MRRRIHGPAPTETKLQSGAGGRNRRWSRFTVAAVAAGAALCLAAGVAYAYYSSTGSATGVAGVGTLHPVTVTAASMPSSPLLPGGTSDVVFNVGNPNSSPIHVLAVAQSSAATPDASHSGCTTTDGHPVVTMNVPPNDLPVSIPAHRTQTITLIGAATMDVAATSNCQGATFSFPLTVTVQP